MIRFDTLTSGSRAIICISVILMCGFLMTRITKLLSLPNVTAYIVTGILLGPYALNIIPLSFVEGSSFLPDIALSFIAFSTGEFFRIEKRKESADHHGLRSAGRFCSGLCPVAFHPASGSAVFTGAFSTGYCDRSGFDDDDDTADRRFR